MSGGTGLTSRSMTGAEPDRAPDLDANVELRIDPLRVVLVDDHALVREGLRSVLATFDDLDIVAEADNIDAAIKAVVTHRPDVVLLDLQLHDQDGADIVRALAAREVDVAVLVLSVHDDVARLRRVLRAGARGYLLKSARPDELAAAIRRVAAGRWAIGDELLGLLIEAFIGVAPVGVPPVTPREREVLDLLAEGLANRAVAERLGISTRTAQKHVENLFKKFNVHERGELIGMADRSGLLA
ncbi:MAG TPA: response regulator transcription factor [Euzebyales bacterium]|nr:response regulator transcription factor [Euzebyales bacterium]